MRVTRVICVGKKLCTINSHSSYPLCFKSMTLKEAIKSSLIILKQVMEEKLNATNIELATVQPGQNFHMFTKEELEEVIKDI